MKKKKSEPKDGEIKQDDYSPSGYSMFRFGEWIPLTYHSKKKKKKNPIEDSIKQKLQEQKRKLELEKINEEFHNFLISHEKLIYIVGGFGYAIICMKKILNIKIN